jgi:glycolate dehydrogenase iron-sulfur subunit
VSGLTSAFEAQRERLLPCVHCGFCLPVCPTYNRLGDEADSPRGRLHLMKLVVEGRLDAGSDAFQTHIDRCLGCRACEPVCPSGVEYGTLLELARESASRAAPRRGLSRLLLRVFASRPLRGLFFLGGRLLRGTGLAALGARVLPNVGLMGSARLGLAMLASSKRWLPPAAVEGRSSNEAAPRCGRVGLLTGCVQEGLYSRVNAATVRVLEANGYEVVPVPGQDCCGALHAHGGALEQARRFAAANTTAFLAAEVDYVVVNAAGCGATMKEYGTLMEAEPAGADAANLAERVRDVTELLAAAGPRKGAPLRYTVAYDHPCHLLHGQGIEREPLTVLAAIPGLEVRVVEGADECCGGAGIYGLTHPELGSAIGRDKVTAVRAQAAEACTTANPGCMMQIGAGLRLEGAAEGVVHPIELLDESYARAGFYHTKSGDV